MYWQALGFKDEPLKTTPITLEKPTSSNIAKAMEKTPQYVGRLIKNLHQKQLITLKKLEI